MPDDRPFIESDTEPEVEAAPANAQPDEFPIDALEWSLTQPSYQRVLVAGFRMRLRITGKLREMRMRREWDEAFATFASERGRG